MKLKNIDRFEIIFNMKQDITLSQIHVPIRQKIYEQLNTQVYDQANIRQLKSNTNTFIREYINTCR